jgi:hypothetical protein
MVALGRGAGGRITGRDDQSHQQHIDSPRCVYAAFFVHKNECHYSNTKWVCAFLNVYLARLAQSVDTSFKRYCTPQQITLIHFDTKDSLKDVDSSFLLILL